MPILTTDTAVLTRTINILDEPSSFLLDMFFPTVQTEPGSEEIHFDIDKERPRLAPFVHPTVAGQIVEDEGYATKSFKPAYVKDKRRITPGDLMKRSIGERIGGELTPAERRDRRIARTLLNQRRNLARREEVMASEALRVGQVTVAGEKYPTVVVDFQRDAGLTVALGGGSLWSATATATPLDDLETWVALIQSKSGAVARSVVMDPEAWKLFRVLPNVKELLDTRRGSESTVETGPIARGQGNEKARLVGFVGDLAIWVYNDVYEDDAGAAQNVMPPNTVILGAQGAPDTGEGGIEGVRAYGAILDPEANFEAERLFAKSWVEKDPAIEFLLAQSAPLIVPYRTNASLAATVG